MVLTTVNGANDSDGKKRLRLCTQKWMLLVDYVHGCAVTRYNLAATIITYNFGRRPVKPESFSTKIYRFKVDSGAIQN